MPEMYQPLLYDYLAETAKRLELLTPDEIFDIANESLLESLKEDVRLERKPAGFSGSCLAEYLSMWANTSPEGGLMAMGMSDPGEFLGCSSLSAEKLGRLESCQITCPDARCDVKRIGVTNLNRTPDFIVLVRVYYRKDRVVKTPQGTAFIRRGDKKIQLKPEEIRELAQDKGEIDFEQESCNLQYPDEFDRDAIRDFANSVRAKLELTTQPTDENILETRHLGETKDGKFTPNFACALLFAKQPDKIIPGCKIRFLRFDGEIEGVGDKFNAVKDEWIEGKTVPRLIEAAANIISSQIRVFSALAKDNKFYAMPEYPITAWYEGLVNACVHRSYGNGLRNMAIYVKMFDDRLEIESPGPFLPFVTPETIYGSSHPRNPKLMHAMRFLDFVKIAGEGTRRMRDTMKEMNLPAPDFSQKEINYSRVRVTLTNNIRKRRRWVDADAAAIVGAAIAKTLTDQETRVLNFVAEHGKINVTEAVRATGLSWETAKKLLTRLAEKQILLWIHRDDLERDPDAHFRFP